MCPAVVLLGSDVDVLLSVCEFKMCGVACRRPLGAAELFLKAKQPSYKSLRRS